MLGVRNKSSFKSNSNWWLPFALNLLKLAYVDEQLTPFFQSEWTISVSTASQRRIVER